jgi:hypothetical protein
MQKQTELSRRIDQRIASFLTNTIGILEGWTYCRKETPKGIIYILQLDGIEVGRFYLSRTLADSCNEECIIESVDLRCTPEFAHLSQQLKNETEWFYQKFWLVNL